MLIRLASVGWGPQFIVPTIAIKRYCGCVVLRENFDDELLKREILGLNIAGFAKTMTNSWYIRKKGLHTWIKIGESSKRHQDFAVRLDTTQYENGSYQILGFMSIVVKTEDKEIVISRQNIAELEILNY